MNYEIDIENNDLSTALIGDEIFSSIIECTHCVGETIIYDEENINESDVDWEKIFSFTNNYTGYEIGCNEFSIPIDKVENVSVYLLALDFLKRLKNKFSDVEFVIYFLINNEKLEIRYHVFRENEEFWIHDFNKIEYPFLCMKG